MLRYLRYYVLVDKDYLLKKSIRTAKNFRLLAKLIDLFIVLILSVLFFPLGVILAICYIGVADSIQHGQSVGKKFMGFRVISTEDGKPCSIKQSVIRNLPIIIPLFLAIIPLWGWILAIIIGVPLMLLETYLLYKLETGHRLGDVMADTTVMAHDDNKLAAKKKKKSWFDGGVLKT
ncbi:MAG: hypothetical protein DRQ88_07570 [Epsilonproteobacteria bacterium]|nr:MAG: hypothetical protein DRQ89_03375 [Campylobacterota bacterium]RLA66182.1 MAG: hypothetical protein DRQ88_07570 [Campylobacterota bacterium]